MRNVEQAIKEDAEVQTNYLVGRGKYTNAQSPEWLDGEDKNQENAHAYNFDVRNLFVRHRI